nr:DNA methyltransferase [Helicobacter pylori]
MAHQYENYNDDLDFESYLNLMHDIFKECYRVLKKDGRICVNVPFAVKNRDSKEVRFLSVYITQILNEIGFKEFELITGIREKILSIFRETIQLGGVGKAFLAHLLDLWEKQY